MDSRTRKGSSTPPAARRALSEFTLPDGRRVLVGSPEDAAALRSWYGARETATATAAARPKQQTKTDEATQTTTTDDDKTATATATPARDDDSDNSNNNSSRVEVVVVHGSDEHRELLDRTRSHAHARREELRRRHDGAAGELLDEWEGLSAQLRDVAAQMERLADHGGGKLNATFSKFGYGAHVRTYGDESGGKEGEEPASSAASTLSGGTAAADWGDRRAGGATMKLFRRPVVKQYFHRGLLWRASALTEVMSFELFLDLVYVGILHVNGEHLSESPDGAELLRFVVTFCMGWKIWADVAQMVSWFDIDDVAQRVEILFLMACLVGMTTNMISTFHEGHDTFAYLVGFYVAARLFMAAYLVLTAVLVPLVRATMLASAVAIVVPAALWVASTALEMPRRRLGLVFVALVLDLLGSGLVMLLYRWSTAAAAGGRGRLGVLSRRVAPHFEFYPAINIEHKVERTNAFVSLVFGYSVVAILFQNQGDGLNAFFGKAILGLVQAYIFNWLYFDVDASNIHVHAIRRSSKHCQSRSPLAFPSRGALPPFATLTPNRHHLAHGPPPLYHELHGRHRRPVQARRRLRRGRRAAQGPDVHLRPPLRGPRPARHPPLLLRRAVPVPRPHGPHLVLPRAQAATHPARAQAPAAGQPRPRGGRHHRAGRRAGGLAREPGPGGRHDGHGGVGAAGGDVGQVVPRGDVDRRGRRVQAALPRALQQAPARGGGQGRGGGGGVCACRGGDGRREEGGCGCVICETADADNPMLSMWCCEFEVCKLSRISRTLYICFHQGRK
ncbi:hypothetical protein RB598_009042 [Gaeumannomyces tritici]